MMGKLCSRHPPKDCPQVHFECCHSQGHRKSVEVFMNLFQEISQGVYKYYITGALCFILKI